MGKEALLSTPSRHLELFFHSDCPVPASSVFALRRTGSHFDIRLSDALPLKNNTFLPFPPLFSCARRFFLWMPPSFVTLLGG